MSGPAFQPKSHNHLLAEPGFARREPKPAWRWHDRKKGATWGKPGFPHEASEAMRLAEKEGFEPSTERLLPVTP